jgi:RimJ/RimL family protein N-acetyltransferase
MEARMNRRTEPPRRTEQGPPVLFDLPAVRARSLRPTDASEALAKWFADERIMGPLNMAPRQLTVPELRRYIESFDNLERYLVGLFAKPSGVLAGLFLCDMNRRHRVATISFLTGEGGAVARRVLAASQEKLLDALFERRGAEKVVAQVAEGNEVIARNLDRLGFTREGHMRAQVRSWRGDGQRLDQWFFGLLREDWRARRSR